MSDPVPIVTVVDGIPRVSSLDIAKKFGKQHDDVLKIIRRVSADLPENFRLGNFAESSYLNGQRKNQPCFDLTRDAFTLVVMGFTGKQALMWKLRYIEAFNAMEAELAGRAKPHPLPRGRKPRYREEEHCTHGQAQRIEAAVNHWCALTGIHRRDALAAIRVRFGLRIFDRPPLRLHEDILRWIGEQCGKDVSSLPTGQAATTRSPRREAAPRASPPSPTPVPVRPPLSLRELMRDAEDCQRRLGILCHGLALTSNETARRWGKPYEKARLQDAIRDNLNAACAASQTALSLLKGIRNLCLAAQ